MIKVLYDYQIFSQEFGGISNYFAKHIEVAERGGKVQIELPIKYSNNRHLETTRFAPAKTLSLESFLSRKIFGKKRYGKHLLESNKKLIYSALQAGNFDVFHPTYYNPYFLPKIGSKPFVIDIHDMTHEIFPEFFNLRDNVSENKKLLTQTASKIIAISQNTKKDLINIFGVDEEKIEVIYCGNNYEDIDVAKVENAKLQAKLPKKYLLFVGNRGGYKNFYFFLNSIAKTLIQDQDLKLVCSGFPFSHQELEFIKNKGLENKIVNFKFCSDEEMIVLYKNARAFVFPSLYEGFGLPILEAFSCSCPVVGSNASSIPEVGQDAALYFEPKDHLSIKSAVEKILYDDNLRIDLVNKGLKRVKDFSWHKSFDKTCALYEKIK